MTVKEYLMNNVRGRVRDWLWKEINKEIDAAENKAAEKGKPFGDEVKYKITYEKTKEIYEKYKSFVEEMENYGEDILR